MLWTGIEEASETLGQPGQDLVMTGYMALSGAVAMVRWDRGILEERLPAEMIQDMVDLERQMTEQRDIYSEEFLREAGASAWYPIAVGGVFNALWYMADHWGTGFTVQLKELPVRQETIEVCEVEEKNPYYLWSSNCMLIAAEHGNRVCEVFRAKGIPAAVVGVLSDKKDKILVHDNTVSCLNRPRNDELDLFMQEHGVPMFDIEE